MPRFLSWLAPAVLSAAALGAGLAVGSPARSPPVMAPAGPAHLLVKVEDVSHTEPGRGVNRTTVIEGKRLEDGAAIPVGLRVSMTPYALPEGAVIRVVARLSPHVPFRNPSPHTPLASARVSQAHALLPSADAAAVVEHNAVPRALWWGRRELRARLDASLSPEVAAVARALTLGDPDALGAEDMEEIRMSGLAHVFAVSGLHVSLLAGLLVAALARLLARVYPIASRYDTGRLAVALGIPFALAIGAFTGAAPSGVRAALTSAFGWALHAGGRRPDPAAVTAYACLGFAAFSPSEALRPAFLLSIAATAAIVSEAHVKHTRLRDVLLAAARLSARTTLATAPIVLWTFDSLPVWGVVANLVFVPVGSLLLVLAALHAAVCFVLPPLSFASALPLSLVSGAFMQGCAWFASIHPAWTWPVLSDVQGVLFAGLAALLLFAGRGRLRTMATVSVCVGLGLAEWRLRRDEQPVAQLRATFLDVGQGDATLIDLPDGRAMLIDGGGNPNGGADPGVRAIVPLLGARRRSHVDVVVLSHPHPDHYLGLRSVLEAVSIGEVWDSGQAADELDRSRTAAETHAWLERARARGAQIRGPPELCDRTRAFGAARVEVIWPCPTYDSGSEPNDNSLVVRIRHGEHVFLFAGDVEAHAEAELVRGARSLRAHVLKVPHHGSATSSGEAFVRAVAPHLAVISAGAVNRFGHPNADVLARYARQKVRTIELSRAGGTIVASDGKSLRVSSWSDSSFASERSHEQ